MQNLGADPGTMYYVIKLKEDSNDYRIYYYRLLNSDTQKFLKKMEYTPSFWFLFFPCLIIVLKQLLTVLMTSKGVLIIGL